MRVKILNKEKLTERIQRWQLQMEPYLHRDFGFLLEAMEGVGLHHISRERKDVLEVDVSNDCVKELLVLIERFNA